MFPQPDAHDTKSIQEMREARGPLSGSHPLQTKTPQEGWQIKYPLLFTLLFIYLTFVLLTVYAQKNTCQLKAHLL